MSVHVDNTPVKSYGKLQLVLLQVDWFKPANYGKAFNIFIQQKSSCRTKSSKNVKALIMMGPMCLSLAWPTPPPKPALSPHCTICGDELHHITRDCHLLLFIRTIHSSIFRNISQLKHPLFQLCHATTRLNLASAWQKWNVCMKCFFGALLAGQRPFDLSLEISSQSALSSTSLSV